MLKMRPIHMLMRIVSENGFVDWYVNKFMPDNLPEFHQALSTTSLEDMVRSGRKTAIAYGFSEPDSIFHFVTLMWIVGPNFMDFSGFKEALENKDLDDAGRIDALYNVDSELSAEAIINADDTAWWRIHP